MASFSIGESSSERIVVSVLAIQPPTDDDQWVSVDVSVCAGGFTANYSADLTADEIVSFKDQLVAMQDTLSGTASLITCEMQLQLNVSMNSRGALSVTGIAVAAHGSGNKLEFRLNLDQSYLSQTLLEINEVCDALRKEAA